MAAVPSCVAGLPMLPSRPLVPLSPRTWGALPVPSPGALPTRPSRRRSAARHDHNVRHGPGPAGNANGPPAAIRAIRTERHESPRVSHGRWCPPRHPCQMPAPPPPARAWGSWDRLPGAGCNAAAGTDVMPRRFRSTPHAAPTIRVRTRQPTVGQGERGVLQHPSAHGFRCRDPDSERTSTPQDEGRRPVDARPPPVRPRSLPLRCWRKPVAPDPVV